MTLAHEAEIAGRSELEYPLGYNEDIDPAALRVVLTALNTVKTYSETITRPDVAADLGTDAVHFAQAQAQPDMPKS